MAYVTGVALLVLVLVAMPLKYLAAEPFLVEVVAPIHGTLYVLYVITGFDLSRRWRWSLGWTILVLLAGAVPFLSFYVERRVAAQGATAERSMSA